MQPLDHQQKYQGCPNLDTKGVLTLPYEDFDIQVLFQCLVKEPISQLYLYISPMVLAVNRR